MNKNNFNNFQYKIYEYMKYSISLLHGEITKTFEFDEDVIEREAIAVKNYIKVLKKEESKKQK